MPGPSQEDEALQRLAVDGRVAFAAAGVSCLMGGLILLDRIGLPGEVTALLGPLIAMMSIVLMGFLLRASRVSAFFAAGRAIPGPYIGLAMAALAAGVSLLYLPPLPAGLTGGSLASGMIGAFVLTGLISAPLLRKTGALTLAGALARRFPHPVVATSMIFLSGLGGLALALAGLDAASALLSTMTGASLTTAMTVCVILITLLLIPGGVNGLTWTQVLAIGLTVASLSLPLIMLAARGTLPPLPWLGDAAAFDAAMTRLALLHPELIGTSDFSVAFVIALGLCAFHPFLLPGQSGSRSADARTGAASGLIWLVIVLTLAAASFAISSLALQSAAGLRMADVPDVLLRAAARGDLTICGAHPNSIAQLREACTGASSLRSGDLIGSPLYLLSAAGELLGFGKSFTSMVHGGLFALLLALASAGAMSLAATLSHEGWNRWRKGRALTSQSLAITRLLLLLVVAGSALLLNLLQFDPRQLLAITLALTASLMAPLLPLSLVARATALEAMIAMALSLLALAIPLSLHGQQANLSDLAQISMVAAGLSFITTLLLCLRHPKDPTSQGATFVAALLHGNGDVIQDDRAA